MTEEQDYAIKIGIAILVVIIVKALQFWVTRKVQ
jgi:hypothetical protein